MSTLFPSCLRRHRTLPALVLLAVLAALAGCTAAPKSGYGLAPADRAPPAAAEPPAVPADGRGPYLALVARMQEQGLWYASLAHLDALEQRHGAGDDSTALRADALRQTGRAADSAALYRRLTQSSTDAAAGWRGLGLLAAADGDFNQAAEHLDKARQRLPTDALLLSDLGYALLRAGRLDDARMPLMQARELRPDHPKVAANLALYLLVRQQAAPAETLMAEQRMTGPVRAGIRAEARRLRADGGSASTSP
ncbi:tetratricopeptide repeat protein [uncultured Xylophilus sp.]|uniref:tetratricopeptide repeat protein n=1 Tax=uncultured Xylophilus sp. TaxID=296832 RepID=UPI0025FE6230|nr:tetratricopeptide repeat protein [uncultured Xylophilus sp.]